MPSWTISREAISDLRLSRRIATLSTGSLSIICISFLDREIDESSLFGLFSTFFSSLTLPMPGMCDKLISAAFFSVYHETLARSTILLKSKGLTPSFNTLYLSTLILVK